jgi:hypothetical protein
MSRTRTIVLRVAAATLGLLIGGGVVFALGAGSESQDEPSGPRPAITPHGSDDGLPDETDTAKPGSEGGPATRVLLLAWSPGGLPVATERRVESIRGVDRATTVLAQLEWITRSKTEAGDVVDDPKGSLAIPFEVAAIEPGEYARLVAPKDRDDVRSLSGDRMLLAETAAELRGAGAGLRVATDAGLRSVSGVVADGSTNGYEGLIASPPPPTWSDSYRFVLAEVEKPSVAERVRAEIEDIAPGRPLQIRTGGENPFLRYGDAVLPQMLVKEKFGEFAAQPLAGGTIAIDPVWRKEHITKTSLPLVGSATCHRDLLPELRSALRDIRDDGLDHLVHPEQFEGCFSPRFISHNPDGNLSHHSWGMAVDLNADENAFGDRPRMDDRIVAIFEKWGFTWGGDWIVPDGMHFEWIGPP